MIKEAADRFGSEKIFIRLNDAAQTKRIPEYAQLGASMAFLGEEVLPEAVNALQKYFEETYPDCEVEVQFGGQPIYYYVISVE